MGKYDPIKRTSKYLSKILRHQPGNLPIQKDGGWANLDTLLNLAPSWVTRENVLKAVQDNDKQRFTINGNRIRANQGHSIEVDLGFEPAVPPSEGRTASTTGSTVVGTTTPFTPDGSSLPQT